MPTMGVADRANNASRNSASATVAAHAMSLNTQKPSPLSANAWCVPPAICAATLRRGASPSVNASVNTSRVAAMVPPVLAKLRVTCSGFCIGNPIARASLSVSAHRITRETYSRSCTPSTSSRLASGERSISTRPRRLMSASRASRVARYLSIGKRCLSGRRTSAQSEK